VSRQVRAEFLDFAKKSTTLHFQEYLTLIEMIPHLQSNELRRISLGFSNSVWFDFLGFMKSPTHNPHAAQMQVPQAPYAPYIQVLQTIGTLEQLNLHFQVTPPREYVVDGYLYSGPVHWTGHDPWNHCGSVWFQKEVACQRDVVDWILTLALPYLRGISSITLSGHIKDSTRAKWERIFADERKGVAQDMSAERQFVTTQLAQPLSVPSHFTFPHRYKKMF
jgi:hypothetical protein